MDNLDKLGNFVKSAESPDIFEFTKLFSYLKLLMKGNFECVLFIAYS